MIDKQLFEEDLNEYTNQWRSTLESVLGDGLTDDERTLIATLESIDVDSVTLESFQEDVGEQFARMDIGLPEISQESFVKWLDKVKSTLTDSKSSEEPDASKLKELATALDKTFGSSTWLKEQVFVEGDIAAKDISQKFEVDHDLPDVKGIAAKVESLHEYIAKAFGPLMEFDKELQQVVAEFKKSVLATEAPGLRKGMIISVAKKLEALEDPTDKIPELSGTGFENTKLTVADDKPWKTLKAKRQATKGSVKLPALTPSDVPVVVALIKTLLTYEMPRLQGAEEVAGDELHKLFDEDSDEYKTFYNLIHPSTLWAHWGRALQQLVMAERLVPALALWLERSVTDKPVAESNTVE